MSVLFRRRTQSQDLNRLSGLKIQSSVNGAVRSIVYGRNRIPGNLIWYGDFLTTYNTVGGKGGLFGGGGKGGQQVANYSASLAIALCEGPIEATYAIWDTQGPVHTEDAVEEFTVPASPPYTFTVSLAAMFYFNDGCNRNDAYDSFVPVYNGVTTVVQHLVGTQLTPMTEVGSSPGQGEYSQDDAGTYTFSAADAGKVIEIAYTYYVQGSGGASNPSQVFNFVLFPGSRPQSPWSYLVSNHPTEALGYSGLAYMSVVNANLGSSGVLPNWNFEVQGFLKFGGGVIDSNPPDFIEDFLTSDVYGAGWDAGEIGDWDNFSDYCVSHGLFMSPVIDQQRTANDWLKDFLQATNSEAIWSSGKLKIITYGDDAKVGHGATFEPPTQPIYDLNDDDFIREGDNDPILIERPTVQDAYNSISVEFANRANSYNPEIVEARDQDAVQKYGLRKKDPIQMHFVTTKDVAANVAQTLLTRSCYVRNKYTFTLNARYILLEPMDLVTVTDEDLGLELTPVRILSIEEQADYTLKITAEEFPWGVSTPTLYPKQGSAGGGPDADAAPGIVNDPIIFEALSRLNDQIGHEIWFGLSGDNDNWGGCNIWMSLDDTSYQLIGTAIQKSKMGELTNTFPSGSDPDTVNTLSVDVAESKAAFDGGTSTDADNLLTLAYVDGELIAYSDATLTGPYAYDFDTYIRRGQLGSTIASHATNSKFLRLDDAVTGYDYDPSLIGKTVYFKFTSFNLRGLNENALSAVTSVPFVITGSSIGLLTPAHASYRPDADPLTATDAGATATINVAAFNMIVPGQPPMPFGSGSITGLLHKTQYYVYFSNPGFIPIPSPTYLVSTTKVDALDDAGNMFVGSIITPVVGGADTDGNNDGGAGAQLGRANVLNPQVYGSGQAGTGFVTDADKAVDGDPDTFAALQVDANNVNGNRAWITLNIPMSINRGFYRARLKATIEMVNTLNSTSPTNPTILTYGVDTNGPADLVGGLQPPIQLQSNFENDASYGPTEIVTDAFAISAAYKNGNFNTLGIGFWIACDLHAVTGSLVMKIYDVKLVVDE